MDNITHTLTGLMMSRAGLERLSPGATAIVLLAANAPDVDVVAAMAGSIEYLRYHRGITHSLVAIPVLAFLPVLLVRLLWRKPVPWKGAYAASVIGVASHVLMDWTNVYGVRLLLPFSERWYNADIFAVVDLWLWAVLLLAVTAPLVSKLVSAEIGARPGGRFGMAVFFLLFCAALGLGRYLSHERAVAVLNSRLYGGEAPIRVGAMPTPGNPFRWVGLVEGSSSFRIYPDLNLASSFDPAAGRTLYKPESGPAIEIAEHTPAFKIFRGFSQWPLWQVTSAAGADTQTVVQAIDLRFGMPPEPRFVATAFLDAAGRIVRTDFRFGSPGTYTSGMR